jgi:hypothetical protein
MFCTCPDARSLRASTSVVLQFRLQECVQNRIEDQGMMWNRCEARTDADSGNAKATDTAGINSEKKNTIELCIFPYWFP